MTVVQSTILFGAGISLTRSQSPTAINLGAFDDAAFDDEAFVVEEDTQDGIALQTASVMTGAGIDLTRSSTAFS